MDSRHDFGDCWTLNSVLLRRDEVEVKTGVLPTPREKWSARSPGFHPAPALVYFGELQPSLKSTNAFHDNCSPARFHHESRGRSAKHYSCGMMAIEGPNPLISTQKSSDSGLQVALHPLVLLTISDYITRHTLRQQKGPVVGGLLGQQNGREITIEHAFECLLAEAEDEIVLNQTWFEERLQQSKIYYVNLKALH
jgi:hypothetical protein